ncbi:unnamed protein product [Linum trigynum]|uniref:Uncharacterized protein n=1 Tax=Linum trigynum TaxID=586398 RepID=A0AAV2DAE2_9ROSI
MAWRSLKPLGEDAGIGCSIRYCLKARSGRFHSTMCQQIKGTLHNHVSSSSGCLRRCISTTSGGYGFHVTYTH